MNPSKLIALVLLAAAAPSCGSESKSEDSPACTAGSSQSCTGPSGCSGYQVCKSDGSGFDPCDCGGGTGGAAGADAGADSAVGLCPTGQPGPELVEVPAPDGTRYCIDSTEVTQAQFDEFLATNPPMETEPGRCLGNKPQIDPKCMTNVSLVPNAPVRCVRWCDAWAYCLWAGKRLCGRIGGGPVAPEDVAKAHLGQWYNACSAGGTQAYAHGDVYDVECDSSDNPEPVRDPKCEGGFPGLYDMSGNAREWLDACAPPNEPGGCTTLAYTGECADTSTPAWFGAFSTVGFRCCHDGTGMVDGGG